MNKLASLTRRHHEPRGSGVDSALRPLLASVQSRHAQADLALIMAHVYFALRPEKLVITKSMITGTLDREHYLEHHDPTRWKPESAEQQ